MAAESNIYLPRLLSRLRADEPFAPSMRDELKLLREEIRENICLLLNSRSRPEKQDLQNDAQLYYSVLGMGLSDVCGCTHSAMRIEAIQKELKEQIVHFEPRLDPASVTVNLKRERERQSELELFISATINLPEIQEQMEMAFTLDLETGIPSLV